MISIVVAVSDNDVIGVGNDLPWKMSGDLKRVKTLTMGHHLIMGRKTYESIGRPLPGRTMVIISRQKDYAQDGCIVVDSLQSAIKIASYDDEAFIFGGGEIFKEAIPYTQKIYLTRVHCIVHGDVLFPQLNHSEWNLISEVNYSADEKNEFDCTVEEWVRRQPF
jgi:dihydrofolate reductase